MDGSPGAESNEPLDALEWARTVEPGRRLGIGEIEAEVMRRRLPPAPQIGVGSRIGQVIGVILVVPLALALLAAPFVGTGIVLAHAARTDPTSTADLLTLGRIAFVVTASLPMAILAIWWNAQDRYRRWWELPAVALVALLAGASVTAVVASGPDAFGSGFVLWIAAALVTGVGTFVGMLVASRPGPAPRRAKRDPADERFEQVRSRALTILTQRGMADIEDRDFTVELVDMPRGGWIERDRQRGRG